MADDKRKKKRGRKTKLNLRSCFPSFAPPDERPSSYYYKSNDRNLINNGRRLGKLITVNGCNNKDFTPDVDILNGAVDVNAVDRDRSSSHRRRISRLFKALLFDSFMVKKINRSSSKSSVVSDTSESSSTSSLSTGKIIKSTNRNNAIHDREYTDLDSSLLSSSSRTTSSSNLSSSRCSSTNRNSQWSYEQKTSSRIDLIDTKHNPISSNSSTVIKPIRSDSLPLPKPKDHRFISSNSSLPLSKPNHDKIRSKSGGNNRDSICWCLLLFLSLAVLMVYGRIYSILCTSTWFYFVPCRKMKRVNSVTNSVKVVDSDSEQYKKRVIMAGLLDRTHNPLR